MWYTNVNLRTYYRAHCMAKMCISVDGGAVFLIGSVAKWASTTRVLDSEAKQGTKRRIGWNSFREGSPCPCKQKGWHGYIATIVVQWHGVHCLRLDYIRPWSPLHGTGCTDIHVLKVVIGSSFQKRSCSWMVICSQSIYMKLGPAISLTPMHMRTGFVSDISTILCI